MNGCVIKFDTDNKVTRCMYTLKEGIIDGFYDIRNEKGILEKRITYVDGVRHGPTIYYENGIPYKTINYINGKRDHKR